MCERTPALPSCTAVLAARTVAGGAIGAARTVRLSRCR